MVLPYLGTALEQTYSVGVALLARPLARSPTLVIHAVGTRSRVEAPCSSSDAFFSPIGFAHRKVLASPMDFVRTGKYLVPNASTAFVPQSAAAAAQAAATPARLTPGAASATPCALWTRRQLQSCTSTHPG